MSYATPMEIYIFSVLFALYLAGYAKYIFYDEHHIKD